MEPGVIRAITYVLVAVVVGLYVVFVVWRVRVDRVRKQVKADQAAGGEPPGREPRRLRGPKQPATPKVARTDRKAAAIAGTTPVNRPDLLDAHQRVIARAAELSGRAPEPHAPPEPFTFDPAAQAATAAAPTPDAGPGPSPFVAHDAPSTPPPSGSLFMPKVVGAASVAELLAGIRLPSDLAPITTIGPRSGCLDRVAFVTTGPRADVVAPAFAAELERLGFAITPQGYDALAVTRGADRGMVVVHPEADQVVIEGEKGFPTAPEHSVVVEVWVPSTP